MLLIFRSYTTEELFALRDKLKASLTTLTSQTVGSKSYTRDLSQLRSQLSAVIFVLNERTNNGYEGTILTDFSAGLNNGQPAGTFDQLTY